MKKYIVLLILMSVLSCKTMTKSVSLGAAVGALTGAGLGGGIYWQDRRKAAIFSGLLGLGVGLAGGYYLYKEKDFIKLVLIVIDRKFYKDKMSN